MNIPKRVSIHGGHSGQFCCHAQDDLESMVKRYIELKFDWVGITEHTPPINDSLRYPDEIQAGISAEQLYAQFKTYILLCRKLQLKYKNKIDILVGMEIETCTGYNAFIKEIINTCRPDYIVGSIHHVDDICIDLSKSLYDVIVDSLGGIDNLYLRFFDLQYEMIESLNPAVIGHFDLVRIFDEDYRNRILKPAIWKKITRNLETIKARGLILDFNLRALDKGAREPYPASPILNAARQLGISVVPGDDSHSVSDIGRTIDTGIALLEKAGFSTDWKKPHCYQWEVENGI